ncbi:MAG: hypothetical protein JXR26_09640, partial [Balneolaceae bacterium]|nr:hypothetical protein [Balneolaceae bacterium]
MKKYIYIWILLFACCGNTGWAQGTDDFFEQWKTQFNNGNYEELLASVEQNLASGNAHPYAINAWVATHKAMGDLSQALRGGNENWRKPLQTYVAIDTFYENDQDWELYNQYVTPAMNELEEQSWANLIIATSELPSKPIKEKLLAYLDKPNQTFRAVWAISNLMENNEKMRVWLGEQYEAGNIDESTLPGRFVYRQAVMHQQSELDLIALLKNEEEL